MPYIITSGCVRCGSCVNVCPVDAISVGIPNYSVCEELCVDCGACAGVCPAHVIKSDTEK